MEVESVAGPDKMAKQVLRTKHGRTRTRVEGLSYNQVYQVKVAGYNEAGNIAIATEKKDFTILLA